MTATRIHSTVLASFAAGALVFAGSFWSPASAQLDDAAQKCVNDINKNATKLAAQVGKSSSKCIKDKQKGKLQMGTTADDCVDDDANAKVVGKVTKLNDADTASCGTPPAFGYTSAAAAASAAKDQQRDLVRALLGQTLDTAISSDKLIGGCQFKIHKAVEKVAKTAGKEFTKCKKAGLKDESITDESGLEACIGDDPNFKIDKAKGKVQTTLDKKCIGVDLDSAFGECGQSGFVNCVNARALGRICAAINGIDGLAAPCDLIDDGLLNGSSPQCGQGIVDAGESCDDGNTTPGDGCDDTCQCEGTCGDGITNPVPSCGEQCDDGNANDNDLCRNNCQDAFCGDGVICSDGACTTGPGGAPEGCDDGASNGTGDGFCAGDCSAIQSCGDGFEHLPPIGTEDCDDGNSDPNDGCDNCVLVHNAECPNRGIVTAFGGVTNNACSMNSDCTPIFGSTSTCVSGLCRTLAKLDTGWSGEAHNADVLEDTTLSGSLLCPGGIYGGAGPGPCNECQVLGVDPTPGNCRCSQNTYEVCDKPFELDRDNCGDPGTGAPGLTQVGLTQVDNRCFNNTDCGGGFICNTADGVCEDFCTSNGDCAAGLACNTARSRCEVTCAVDSDCNFCSGNPNVKCTSAAQCSGVGGQCTGTGGQLKCDTSTGFCAGTCECYLGSVLPLSTSIIPVCVANKMAQDVGGTANIDTGSSALDVTLRSVVHLTNVVVQPCPVCGGTCTAGDVGDTCRFDFECDTTIGAGNGTCGNFDTPGDGTRDGTCTDGPDGGRYRGMKCEIDAFTTTFPAFPGPLNGGGLSLDCFPGPSQNVSGQGLLINLDPTTGSLSLPANLDCGGAFTGLDCWCKMCSGNQGLTCNSNAECAAVGAGTCSAISIGKASQPNKCFDLNGVCEGDPGQVCTSNADCACIANECANGSACNQNSDCAVIQCNHPQGKGGCEDSGVGVPGTNGVCEDPGVPGNTLFFCDGIVRANGNGLMSCNPSNRICSDGQRANDTPNSKCANDGQCLRCTGGPTPGAPCGVSPTACGIGGSCSNTGVTCEYTECYGTGVPVPATVDNTTVGDCILSQRRNCFLDPIISTGVEDTDNPISVAQFCIGPVANPGINGTAGLPGPGRTKLAASSTLLCTDGVTIYNPTGGVSNCP